MTMDNQRVVKSMDLQLKDTIGEQSILLREEPIHSKVLKSIKMDKIIKV